MPLAIGTSLVQTFGQSIIATVKHNRMGNVDWRLGALSVIGSIGGVEVGKRMIFFLERIGHADSVIRWAYMLFLSVLGIYILRDYLSATRKQASGLPDKLSSQGKPKDASIPARGFRSFSLPPHVSLPTSGIQRISFWSLFAVFFVAGFLSGFMGVGGGFILLPALIYLIGVPTTTAIGTSLLGVTFMAGYGSFAYSLAGLTELAAALVMLIGASAGTQFGALATRYVHGYGIRLLFSMMLLLAGFSVALKQVSAMFGIRAFDTAAGIVVLGAAGGMALHIIVRLFVGMKKRRRDDRI